MQQKPLRLLQFQKKFGTEKACQKQLFRMRWPKASSVLIAVILKPISTVPVIYINANPAVTKLR